MVKSIKKNFNRINRVNWLLTPSGNKGHFANKCSEPKKVNVQITYECVTNVLSSVLLIESSPFWIVDSNATDHITNSIDVFMDFRRVPRRSKWIHVGNNENVKVLKIGNCKLVLRGGRVLFLYVCYMFLRFDEIWYLSFCWLRLVFVWIH